MNARTLAGFMFEGYSKLPVRAKLLPSTVETRATNIPRTPLSVPVPSAELLHHFTLREDAHD
jgi:hypothetical protein